MTTPGQGGGDNPPPATDYQVVIAGGGFSGLCLAHKLRGAGIEDFLILEKAPEPGGTWFANTYPGCACDVPSSLYSFSFEPNPEWSRSFSPQPEILGYLKRFATKRGLLPHLCLSTALKSARFDEQSACWRIVTSRGDALTARILVSACGQLSLPRVPEIPGLDDFRGASFHSQQWDHDHALSGRRVGVIGTGASAIQFVPEIVREAAETTIFQRTPPWVVPRSNRALTRLEKWCFRRMPWLQTLRRVVIYWLLELFALAFLKRPGAMRLLEWRATAHMRRHISDESLRARLKPDYRLGCKRILFSNAWYPTLARAGVRVVTEAVTRIEPEGVRTADGELNRVDTLIFATGFRASDPVPPGCYFGRDGRDLAEVWADGPEAYLGTSVAGFPNFFLMLGPNTTLGHSSMILMIEAQARYVVGAIETIRSQGVRAAEVKAAVQSAYNASLQKRLAPTVWMTGGCSSWYLHPGGRNVTLWPGFTWQFMRRTRRFDIADYATT